jgi:hypothetical protein
MTAALIVAGWFVCWVAGVSLWNAVDNAHQKDKPNQMPIYAVFLGAAVLSASLLGAIAVAVTRKDGGQ